MNKKYFKTEIKHDQYKLYRNSKYEPSIPTVRIP